MAALGWQQCDIIIVTGDAYVDHPSFGMAIIGRVLEAQGFKVGIIAQPDWQSAESFQILGEPRLFFGVTGGNMDSMVNRYTSERRVRSDDAYTPGGMGGRRPDRCVIVYSQRMRESYKSTPIVIGGIEASLRRIAHFDYWSERVRRSVLVDAKADLLVYGNAERQIGEIARRLGEGCLDRRHHRFARHGISSPRHAGGLGGNRLERSGCAGRVESADRSLCQRGGSQERLGGGHGLASAAAADSKRRRVGESGQVLSQGAEFTARTQRDSHAVLRAGERRTRCCMRMRRGSCTWSRIPEMRAPWCSATARRSCG